MNTASKSNHVLRLPAFRDAFAFATKVIPTVVVFAFCASAASAATFCESTVLWKSGYKWQHWKSPGTQGWNCMTELGGLSYKSEWNASSYGFVSQVGKDNINKYINSLNVNATAYQSHTATPGNRPGGGANIGFYGWMGGNPKIEWYIVDNYYGNKPGPNSGRLNDITVDGRVYEVYRSSKSGGTYWGTNEPFTQYWSIAKIKRTAGTVSYVKHFKAWQTQGLGNAYLKNVMAYVEPTWSYNSNGKVVVSGIQVDTP